MRTWRAWTLPVIAVYINLALAFSLQLRIYIWYAIAWLIFALIRVFAEYRMDRRNGRSPK